MHWLSSSEPRTRHAGQIRPNDLRKAARPALATVEAPSLADIVDRPDGPKDAVSVDDSLWDVASFAL